MDVKQGKIKYKDRDDILCIFGSVPETNSMYYFMDPNDEIKFSNGNRIVSTELVEAIDPMVKCEHIGVIDPNGNVVIPFENKSIKPITDSLVLAEKATPTSESVINAINLRNNPESATTLVSTPAKIKDSIYKEMGTDGRFVFNDQFSEATIYDIYGNNVLNNVFYSFIAMNASNIYLSSNVPDSKIFTLGYAQSDVATNETSLANDVPAIDVGNVEVPQGLIDNALNEVINEEVVNQDLVVDMENQVVETVNNDGLQVDEQPFEYAEETNVQDNNVFEASVVPTENDTTGFGMDLADMNLAAANVVADDVVTTQEEVVEENSTMETPTQEVVVENNEVMGNVTFTANDIVVPITNEVEHNAGNEEVSSFQTVAENAVVTNEEVANENVTNDLVAPLDDIASYAENVVDSVAMNEEEKIDDEKVEDIVVGNTISAETVAEEVANVELVNDITAENFEAAPNLDDLNISNTTEEEVTNEEEVAEETVVEETTDEKDVEETHEVNNIFEKFGDEESTEDSVVGDNEEEKTVETHEDEVKLNISLDSEETEDKKAEDIFSSIVTDAKTSNNTSDNSDIRDLVDSGFDDLFKPTAVRVDTIDRSYNDSFLDSYVDRHSTQSFSSYSMPSVGGTGIMADVAKSMTSLIRQNKEQRNVIAQYKGIVSDLTDNNRRLTDKVSNLQRQNDELASKVISFEAAMSKVKVRYEAIEDKVRHQENIIAQQAQEIEVLRPQIEAQDKLADILKDAQAILGETSVFDDESTSFYRAA